MLPRRGSWSPLPHGTPRPRRPPGHVRLYPAPPRHPPAGGAGAPPRAPVGPVARTRGHAALSGARVVSRRPGPARAGRLGAGRQGARRSAPPHSAAACRGDPRAATVSLASSTLGDAPGRAPGPGSASATRAIASGRDRRGACTHTLRRQRAAAPQPPTQGAWVAETRPSVPGPRTASVAPATERGLGARHAYRRQPMERPGSPPRLHSAGLSGGWVAVAPSPMVVCLVLVGEKTVPDPRALDGEDRRALGLFGDATSTTPPVGTPPRDAAAPEQPTERPTYRGVFQRLAGIHRVRVTVQGTVQDLVEGLNKVQSNILRLCGEEVC